jgi:nucleoid DNA-binding protein
MVGDDGGMRADAKGLIQSRGQCGSAGCHKVGRNPTSSFALYLTGIVRGLRSGDKVEIRGFGSFHTRQRRARIGRNPKTGARVEVPPKNSPFLKPSKELRELVSRI